MTQRALPSPYDYLDHRRYLADWFRAKKEANPNFSHRVFARRAEQKNPSLLHHVIEGRRNLTERTLESFVKALSLRAGEAQFFRLLVELDQAKTPEARNDVWERISATRRFREARRIERSSFEYLSNWVVPTVRELARRRDFRPDPEWIAEQLRPRVGVAEAARALQVLMELGLLVEEDGTLAVAEASVATPPEITRLAVANYHRGMLELAAGSIERFPGSERHLIAITVGVPESLIPTLKAEANAFLERMMNLCDGATADTDKIMQMNLQLFPLTAGREEIT
ncbi:MAG: TIGR02147 family protein [Alphaproteobacteria bacterium]|nr:TIGR02147 family protein [Alphaproteobacteria bacterium]